MASSFSAKPLSKGHVVLPLKGGATLERAFCHESHVHGHDGAWRRFFRRVAKVLAHVVPPRDVDVTNEQALVGLGDGQLEEVFEQILLESLKGSRSGERETKEAGSKEMAKEA
jgi:hypothetical protein